MKAHLLYRDRDFDWRWALRAAAAREAARTGRRPFREEEFDPHPGLPWNAEALTADLSLTTLFETMARDDDCVFEAARKTILGGIDGDLETIQYRQAILQDALKQAAVVRELYVLAAEAVERQKGHFLGLLTRYPDSVLRDAMETIGIALEFLKRLRKIADLHAPKFSAEGWTGFFARLARDLDDDYFALVENHLEELKFRGGELLSAELGQANKGRSYKLHRTSWRKSTWSEWWTGLFEKQEPAYSFEIHPRDQAGTQALTALRNRGISLAANALGQAAAHLREFFGMLRVELAFYIGCLNLHERLLEKGEPTCIPIPSAGRQRLTCRGLYDVGLTLSVDGRVIGNEITAEGKNLIFVTGPNTGGKSTFLRSLGLAQLMMQSGMFVAAESYGASLCHGLYTHYKREEDVAMESGKFAEELSRMSAIIDHVASDSMILFNESFAATNEREGSEIARQIVSAMVERGIRAVYVTHMYELAHGFYRRSADNALFLRAGRAADGARTFKVTEGEPLPTSFGEDLYNRIFCTQTTESVDQPGRISAGGRDSTRIVRAD